MGEGWKRAIKAAENSRRDARQFQIQRLTLGEGSRVVWRRQTAVVTAISTLGMVSIEVGGRCRKVDPKSLRTEG